MRTEHYMLKWRVAKSILWNPASVCVCRRKFSLWQIIGLLIVATLCDRLCNTRQQKQQQQTPSEKYSSPSKEQLNRRYVPRNVLTTDDSIILNIYAIFSRLDSTRVDERNKVNSKNEDEQKLIFFSRLYDFFLSVFFYIFKSPQCIAHT